MNNQKLMNRPLYCLRTRLASIIPRTAIDSSFGGWSLRRFAIALGVVWIAAWLNVSTANAQDFHPIPPATDPPPLPAEMESLFVKMEAAVEASQKVFEPLLVDQMNFRPANGSHTPRWNVEHMGGRQALFFSQLFNAVDPRIPIIDVNPKQMPDDYQFAHPQRSGQEEAIWMGEVSDYCRRYAYLLADMDLDAKPPVGRWPSLRRLLVTMQRHYGEHTANVVKKFDLPGFPSNQSNDQSSDE